MRDIDVGKRMVEEMVWEAFEDAFPRVLGRSVESAEDAPSSVSPDFECLLDGQITGVEITRLEVLDDEHDLFASAYRLAAKKSVSYTRRGLFDQRPIILVCYSYELAFFDVKDRMEEALSPEDFSSLGFSEVWLMDLCDAYYDAQDPRRPPDLFCAKPEKWLGFHRFGDHGRKPYG